MKKFLDIFEKKIIEEKKELIEVDYREKNSGVPAELLGKGYEIVWKQLPVGDYIVRGVAIERKTVSDLKGSILDKRIFSQLKELKGFEKNFLLIEGIISEDIYSGGLHENVLRGFMLSVALDFNIGVVYTRDYFDTAKYIDVLARRKENVDLGIRASKIYLTDSEKIQFILEGFPNVGVVKARELIKKFGSLREIFRANEKELKDVLGKRAKQFKSLLDFREI